MLKYCTELHLRTLKFLKIIQVSPLRPLPRTAVRNSVHPLPHLRTTFYAYASVNDVNMHVVLNTLAISIYIPTPAATRKTLMLLSPYMYESNNLLHSLSYVLILYVVKFFMCSIHLSDTSSSISLDKVRSYNSQISKL